MKTELTFRVITDLHLSTDGKDFTQKPKHEGVSVALEMSKNVEREYYFDTEGQANATGRKTTQTVLIQGLMGTLKLRAEKDGLDLEKLIYETMAEVKKWAEREADFEPSKLKDL
jgi:hypothetical protein